MNMTVEQMQSIVDSAPIGVDVYDTKTGLYRVGIKYYENDIYLNDLRTELEKHEPMDIKPCDIPHGTIVIDL